MQCRVQMIRIAGAACTGMKNIRTKRCMHGINSFGFGKNMHVSQRRIDRDNHKDEDETIVLIRKNGEETIA